MKIQRNVWRILLKCFDELILYKQNLNQTETQAGYSKRRYKKERGENMKKLMLGIVGTAGVVAGAIVIWKVVIPFIGMILTSFF